MSGNHKIEMIGRLRVSAPGRICLFGEHQDYLGLPVISSAISLRITIDGKRIGDKRVRLTLPDIGSEEEFEISGRVTYVRKRDYFRSGINVMQAHGYTFSSGFDCEVKGNIPINSGTSSSSALVVAWIGFLGMMSDQMRELPPGEAARFAHEAEVAEFGEPGGMMDHISCAYGGVNAIDFQPEVLVTSLKGDGLSLVLVDSMESKKTASVLSGVKNRVAEVVRKISGDDPSFSLRNVEYRSLGRYERMLDREEVSLLRGTVRNRDITEEARRSFLDSPLDRGRLYALLNEHHGILRDVLRISTPKIERIISAAAKSGAPAAKINGSGGGGCLFILDPPDPQATSEACEREGGRAYVVDIGTGLQVDLLERGT